MTDEVKMDDEAVRWRMTGKQHARQSSPDRDTSTASSKRQKRGATIAAIKEEVLKTVPEERPDLEQVHNFHAIIRTARSEESIHASRLVGINKWKERGVVERWSRAKAMASCGKICQARWADDPFKEKSRNMFAAASDTAVGRVVEYKAVL